MHPLLRTPPTFFISPTFHSLRPLHRTLHQTTRTCKSCQFDLHAEVEQARREARPYKLDKTQLTPVQWQQLKERSRAIPMVADHDPLDVVFEDERFLVVNKPAYLKMHPCHRFQGGSLLNRAIGYCGFEPMLLHRLDMHTTGVVVLSKQRALCKPMMNQFMNGLVKKEYLCIVDGTTQQNVDQSFIVDAPIQRHPQISYMREVGTSAPDSKPAQTVYTILQKSLHKNMMLLHAAPRTGRTHQIRVHAQHTGLPIVGDDLYNAKEHERYSSFQHITDAAHDPSLARYGDNNPLRAGLKLHAWKISFSDPQNDQPLQFCAPPPEHMRKLLEWSGMPLPLAQ